MNPWDDHERWYDELRQFLGDDADELSEEDLMFVSNLAAQTVHGEISLPKAIEELHRWERQRMGVLSYMGREAFELELAVNNPDLIDVTRGVQENLRFAEEPGIADAIIQIYAHPRFEEFSGEGSMVAIQHKGWFALERLTEAEHHAMGWAIAQAVKERNDGN